MKDEKIKKRSLKTMVDFKKNELLNGHSNTKNVTDSFKSDLVFNENSSKINNNNNIISTKLTPKMTNSDHSVIFFI